MNHIKTSLAFLEKKLKACPDSKQKTIDKDIYNLLVAMTKELIELEKKVKKQEEEINRLRNPAEELLTIRDRIYASDKFFKEHFQDKYTWKDIVKIGNKVYPETFPISGKQGHVGTRTVYEIDDFLEAVAEKHNVDVDDVETYMMDNIDFDANELPYGAESCGCYINGVPEWSYKHELDMKESED